MVSIASMIARVWVFTCGLNTQCLGHLPWKRWFRTHDYTTSRNKIALHRPTDHRSVVAMRHRTILGGGARFDQLAIGRVNVT